MDDTSPRSLALLEALNRLAAQGKLSIYEGTANPNAVAKRRTRNRAARVSRRINRKRSS